ncbi:hypothetical protein CSOJ01_03046 [Colletotrichum sojae]|uniref:F-box domain-containing protein n=1 Tax=Colletotrichum sojae TaxID=2175907 RepID=A0A8H6N1T2_9PEZI|nr:hypothetical protein CSOJ01_03046 [Colletotrichum sojae]
MPEDVFHTICEHLDFPDILRLVRTNSHFAAFERGLLLHNDLVRETNRALCWACRRGDLALAEKYLKMGCNPNYYPNACRGEELFWLRIWNGSKQLEIRHLSRLYSIQSPPKLLVIFSVIAQAIMQDRTDVLSLFQTWTARGIRYLLEAGAHPDCMGPYSLAYVLGGMTPLETALALMNSATVKALLDWGVSLENARGLNKGLGLYYVRSKSLFQANSSMETSQGIMSLLIHHDVDIGFKCRSGNLQSPDFISNPESDAEDLNLFQYVVEHGTSDFLRFLVDAGADPYTLMPQGHTSIPGRNSHSHSSALQAPQWILKEIENRESDWQSKLCLDEDTRMLPGKLKALLETHPQLCTPAALYTFAIRSIEMKFLEKVLRVINLTRSDFRCPWGTGALARLLHRGSVLRGHLGHLHDCVLLLLRTGANVNNFHKGKTALQRAFSLTIASPQDYDDMDVEDSTVDWDHFLVYGQPIYPDFSTEEHAALRQDNVLSIIISLLLNGADPKVEDDEEKTPAWYAKTNGWLDLDSPKAVAIRDMVERAPVYPWREREDHATCYETTGEWD